MRGIRDVRLRAFLFVGGLLCGPAVIANAQLIGAESEITVHAYGGSAVSMSGRADTGITPFALLYINAPIGEEESSMLPSIQTTAMLSKLPGAAAVKSVTDKLDQYKSIEFSVGAQTPLVASHRLNLGVEAGFASRLPGENEPRDQTARWVNGFVKFRAEKGFLQLGFGADQRLTGQYRPAITVVGAVQIVTVKKVSKRMKMMGVISAILGADAPIYRGNVPEARDVVRVGVVVGL